MFVLGCMQRVRLLGGGERVRVREKVETGVRFTGVCLFDLVCVHLGFHAGGHSRGFPN